MRFKTLIPILSIIAMSAAAGEPPKAQSQQQASQTPTFETLDTNHNNLIDPSESRQMPKLASAFNSADANHDGNLDKNEFTKAVAQIEQGSRATGHG
jgi:Ca2+-binding EF-hand superfamily protein